MSETSERQPTLDGYDVRRIESLTAPMLFDELLQLASEVCLHRPLEFKPRDEVVDSQAAIVAKLGLGGLRAAIDISRGRDWPITPLREDDESSEDTDFIQLDSPLREPKAYSDEVDLDILDKARQFGEALLDEAYKTLGQDVYQKLVEFRAAQTDTEQLKVIEWLDKRLAQMTDKQRGFAEDTQDGASYYHPIRLAPQAIGRYPDHNYNPTCLGVSVIAASFFEQAGADHMHGGVMESRLERYLNDTSELMLEVAESYPQHYEVELPAVLNAGLEKKAIDTAVRMITDGGYHAASYVRLKSGDWCQVDSNYNASGVVQADTNNQELTDRFGELQSFASVAPGLELTAGMGMSTLSLWLRDWLKGGSSADLPDQNEITQFLLETEHESLPELIKQRFITPFFTGERAGVGPLHQKIINELSGHAIYEDAFYTAFEKYVLWGESPGAMLARCASDSAYLACRTEDIRALPLVVAASTGLNLVNYHAGDFGQENHSTVEVGLPAARVGMAVLSDFAMYCDDRLPASFWLTHWPSYVPMTETVDDASRSSAQDSILSNKLNWLTHVNLKYIKSHVIVQSFLSVREKRGEQDAEA